MKKKTIFLKYFLSLNILLFCTLLHSSLSYDIETGFIYPGYNNVKIPRDSGTLFSLTNDLKTENKYFYRVRITKNIGGSQFVSLLYAPLSLSALGKLQVPVIFDKYYFEKDSEIKGIYRFDSYRITYYKIFKSEKVFRYKLGFTAKIRDASISISDSSKKATNANTGFVPLINLGANYNLTKKINLIFDADTIFGGPGRASDVLIALNYTLNNKNNLRIGYRFVEGGADVEQVYNFALLNYLIFGISF